MVKRPAWFRRSCSDTSIVDHDRDTVSGHDITGECLYRDVYRDGAKVWSEDVSSPIPANEGFDTAEEDFFETVDELIEGFKNGTE